MTHPTGECFAFGELVHTVTVTVVPKHPENVTVIGLHTTDVELQAVQRPVESVKIHPMFCVQLKMKDPEHVPRVPPPVHTSPPDEVNATVLTPSLACRVAGISILGQQVTALLELLELDRELLDELEQQGHPLILSTVTGIFDSPCHSASCCQNTRFRHDQIAASTLHIGYDLDTAR